MARLRKCEAPRFSDVYGLMSTTNNALSAEGSLTLKSNFALSLQVY
jgi:hypothetical protein